MKKILLLSVCLFVCWALFAQQRIKVACVGNSITYGTGLADRATQSYPVQLQKLLGEHYEVENFGEARRHPAQSGTPSIYTTGRIPQSIGFCRRYCGHPSGESMTPTLVTGTNYRDSFVTDYLNLMDTFRKANPDVRIIIARMTPIADRHNRFLSGTRDWHGEMQTAIETVAHYAGVQLIDFREPLYPYPFLLPDAVHPTAEGLR